MSLLREKFFPTHLSQQIFTAVIIFYRSQHILYTTCLFPALYRLAFFLFLSPYLKCLVNNSETSPCVCHLLHIPRTLQVGTSILPECQWSLEGHLSPDCTVDNSNFNASILTVSDFVIPVSPHRNFNWWFFAEQTSHDSAKANGDTNLLVNDQNKYKSMKTRVLSSVWMIGGFVGIVYMGHLYIWAMIVVIQLFMAQELFTLARAAQRGKNVPGFRLLNWWVSSWVERLEVNVNFAWSSSIWP